MAQIDERREAKRVAVPGGLACTALGSESRGLAVLDISAGGARLRGELGHRQEPIELSFWWPSLDRDVTLIAVPVRYDHSKYEVAVRFIGGEARARKLILDLLQAVPEPTNDEAAFTRTLAPEHACLSCSRSLLSEFDLVFCQFCLAHSRSSDLTEWDDIGVGD